MSQNRVTKTIENDSFCIRKVFGWRHDSAKDQEHRMSDETTPQDDAAMPPASTGSVAWIRTSDKLPPLGQEVLVTADGWMRIAYIGVDGWMMPRVGKLDTAKPPTHWMPLPWHVPLP